MSRRVRTVARWGGAAAAAAAVYVAVHLVWPVTVDGGWLAALLRHAFVFGGPLAAAATVLSRLDAEPTHESDRPAARPPRLELLTAKLVEQTIDGIVVTDADGTIEMVNPAFTTITGYSREEAIGANPRILKSDRQSPEFYREMWRAITDEGQWSGEIWNRHKDGEAFPEWMTISAIRDPEGEITNYVSVFRDLSAIKQRERQIQHLAHHDPLTGVPNRLLFEDRLDQALARARRNRSIVALAFFDLDHFKEINDALGHPAGDRALQLVARRIREQVREQDTVCRHGGDEFLVLVTDLTKADDALRVVRAVSTAIAAPLELVDRELVITASCGVAFFPDDGENRESLIANADLALYRAKQDGKDATRLFAAVAEEAWQGRAG